MATSRALLLLSSLPALLGAGTAYGLEYQCERGAQSRSVAVEYREPDQRVPCEVIYHKPPQDPRVLWRANVDVGFCEDKAEELIQTLESGGWACDQLQESTAAAPRELPARPPESAQPTAPQDDSAQAEEAPEPEPTARSDGQDTLGDAAGRTEERSETAAAPPAAPSSTADPVLEAALARDLSKLKASSDGDVQADSASYGDLDGDGRDDAAVLITFDSGGADYVQYLVAYVFRDDTYQPKASHLIGGRHRDVHRGEIMGISQGAIVLDLQILKPEDAACCPSGSRTAVFVLENGDLVPIGE